ncbi:hypothetical protein F4679DRAFT_413134 [Xylaria curta]|nr:hypothetical protein F4679DRAFT_413134 [Xylaria curta]
MGILYNRRDGERASHPIIRSNSQSISGEENTTVDPWLIVVIVAGSLILVTLVGVLLAHYVRSRRRRGKGLFHPVEKVRSVSFSRKDAAADRQKIEDLERDMMIRKSLASRPASASFPPPPASQPLNNGDDHPEQEEEEEEEQQREEMTSLREDWKAWEARVQTERGTAYPGGVGLDQHPAFAPYLSVPQPTRMPSPHRIVGVRPS